MNKFYTSLLLTFLLFIGGNAFGQNTYKLITSTSDLVAGEKYIISSSQTAGSGRLVLGYQNTNNRPQATSTVTIATGTPVSITTTPATATVDLAKAYEITLGGSSGSWTLYDNVYNIYLVPATGSSSNNYLKGQATGSAWTISFSSNAAVMTNTGNPNTTGRNVIQYNSGASLFSCYTAASQSPVYLYRRAYPVIYDGNGNSGGSVPTDASSPYFTGATVTVKANTGTLVRTGYTFSGWNTKADGTGTNYAATGSATYTKTAANDTLFAKWVPSGYTVTFDANGGTGTMANQTASSATYLTLNTFTRAGYTFAGWATTSGGAVAYTDGDSYPFTANATLYAVWTPNNNTITFDGNGATGGATSTQTLATAATAALNLNGYTKTGFTFSGWATSAGGSVAYADGASYTMGTSNVTLYAVWVAAGSYTVIFDANGGTGTMANQTANTPTALNSNAFTRSGYIFNKWNTAADGSGTDYANGATYAFSANATLYALWTPTYTVTYNGNSNTSGTAPTDGSSPYVSGVTVTVLANTGSLARTGYTFAGWNTASNGSGTDYAATGSATFSMPAANTVLYAKWTPNNNTITFDGNGATGGSMSNQTIATGATATLTTNAYTRTGYTFAGWATTSGGAVAYTDGASYTMGTASVTLYAKWTPNNNTITFDGNGATGGSMSNQTIATGATATLTTNAYTRTGYTFAGWATTSGGAVAYTNGASYTMGTSSVTLYAVWNVYVGPCETQDFESGSVPGTWTTGGGTTAVNGSSGDYYLNLNENGEYAQLPVGANTYSSVSFNVKGSASSNNWTLYVQYSSDGTSWNNALTIAGTSVGTSYSLQTTTLPVASQYVRLYLTRTGNSCYIGNLDAFCVTCTAPGTQASSVSTNTPTTDGFSIGWTAGDGDGTMIVVRPTSSSNATPAINTSYTPNLAWASAGQIDVNNRVVFKSAGTSAGPVTGLSAETQYTITAYEYNSTDNCYKLTSPSSTTRYTLSTEPTAQPTSGFSSTTCTANSIDLTIPAPSAGADGYIVLQKSGSAPTGLPTDANSYSVSNTIGDATVAAIVTSAGTYTITGLSAGTNYYFQLVPYNANSGAVAQTYNYLTGGTLLQTNFSTLVTGTSTASTVETDATYSYTQNIAYASYQSTPVPASAGSSVGVHNIIIKDGGATTDADALPTILTGISYSYSGTANTVRAAALFTTTGSKVADGTVGANSITFTGMSGSNVTTNDNNSGGAKELILRVTFNTTVTDNQKLVFTVTSVTGGAICSYSQFAAANGGGAISENTGTDDNRIEVVADRIVFGTQPITSSVNTNIPSFTIRFQDANGNLDFDNNRTVTLTATDGGVNMSAAASYSITATHTGIVTFSDVQFTSAPQTAITITASTTGLASSNTVKSNPFDIFDIPVGSYKTTTDGVWSSSAGNNTITWQELTGSGWTTMISPSYPSTATTNRVYIFNNVTLNGTNTAKNIIVESTGTLSTSTVTPTFKNLLIKTGGVFNKNPGNGLKFDSDGVLEVEDGATFNYSHTNATSRSTNLWNGTEKFHPKSNFVVKETDNSVGSGNQVVESASDVSSYNGAKFGNFIVDMGSAGGKVPLFVSGLSTKLTNGDFILRTGSDNGMIFNSGDYTDTIGGNLIIESTYTQPFTLTNSASTVNFTVNDNVVHNGTAEFRLANSQTTNNPSVTLNIDSNLVIGTSNFNFDIGTSSTGSNKSIVNLKGDLTVGTGNILTQNTATAKKGEFNFTGTYNSSDSTTIQTVDVASTGATTENARVNFNVKSGAYTQLINRDFEIGTNSKLTVETGSIFDFGFSGTTALNVAISASQTGAAFESKQASTLKITSIDGLYGNWNTTVFPSVTQTTGNLRLSKSNRTIDNLATFWYIGKQNQQTGDGPNANNIAGTYSSTPDGKVVICELANNSLTLTPSLSFGFTSNTSVNSTYGGHLYIKKGQFRETTSAFVFSGGGTLRMEPGTYYYIPKGNANLAASDADPIPRMSGLIHPTSQYYLNGGTIELAGTGGSDGYQSLRGNTINPKNYINVTFSGANVSGTDYKNLTSTVVIDSALTITGDAIVECHGLSLTTPQSFTGPGGLVMSGANSRIRIRKLAVEQPELTGYNVDYALTGGTVEFYSSGATQQQLMRGNFTTSGGTTKLVDYYNIDINADAANWSTTSTFADAGNVNMASSCKLTGTLNVNAPAVFRMDKTDAISNGTGSSQVINIKDYAGLLYGSPNGIKNSGTGTSDGNFRTSGTRNFSSKASYGFISSGDMVTGNGLPATVNGLYVYKFDPTDKVTLTATVRADSILKMSSGHIITGSSFFVELGKDVINRGTLDYNTGYVVGKMRRWYNGTNSGNASGLFPLGEDISGTLRNRKYLIEFSSAPSSGGYLDVNFNHVDMGMAGLPIAGIPAVGSCSSFDVTTTEDEGYWIGTPQSSALGDGAYDLSLTGENFSTVTDLCQLTLLKRVGTGNWTAPGNHEIVTGSISEPTVKRSNISGFSNFGFGGGAPNPLPVELTSFSGVCVEDGISQISWSTASEFNSKEFIVQRSEDGVHYKNIAVVPSSGNSDSPKHYSIKDTASSANSSYYRLVQVDYDGKQTIYSFIQVRCGEVSYSNIFYAQPSIVVEISADKNKEIGFNVYEISGRLIHHENKQIARGFNRFDLNLQKKLPDGIYIIQMTDGNDVSTTKVMVH
ncbi:MAG: InlB B-repeat-containing protein [Chitinophagales bacterium]